MSRRAIPESRPVGILYRRVDETLFAGTEGGDDVTKASPEAALLEIVEVEVPVELGRSLIDGIDDHGPSAEFTSAA